MISEIFEEIDLIMKKTELDESEEEGISVADYILRLKDKHTWEALQSALFSVLADNSRSEEEYYQIALVFYYAALDNEYNKSTKINFNKETILGLLYYRLSSDEFYDNILWSITTILYNLDYANSDYEPMKDERIIREIAKYGFTFKELG